MKKKWKGHNSIPFFVAAILIMIGVTWAVFTYQANKKGVLSTEAIDTNFTSNYLRLCSYESSITTIDPNKYEGQTLLFSEEAGTVSFDVTVQNYQAAGTNNDQSIDYSLNLILESTGTEYGTLSSYTLTDITNGSGTATPLFSESSKQWISSQYTLQGGYDSIHTFRITIPTDALNKVQLLMVAQPTQGSLISTNQKMLARIFAPCTESNVKEFACTHEFTDSAIDVSADDKAKPFDLDAFNYQISINTGSAWVTLSWDTRYVTIDPSFKDRVTTDGNGYVTNGNMKSLVFKMDTAEAESNLIQFYRNVGRNSADDWQKSWDAMELVITSSATQISE